AAWPRRRDTRRRSLRPAGCPTRPQNHPAGPGRVPPSWSLPPSRGVTHPFCSLLRARDCDGDHKAPGPRSGDAGWRLPASRPSLEPMTPSEIALRFGAAVVVGGAIGLTRALRGKPAGVRTHALVSLGSAVVTVVAATVAAPALDTAAVSRVMQGIITGIGFLGAGGILHEESGRRVRGLTTAATIWIVAALGIACGVADWAPVGL